MMLKPLHIICLLALLGVGCKKEEQVSTLPDSTPQQYFFTIKDTAEYSSADFYINPTAIYLPQGYSSTYYDIDGDSVFDFKFKREQYTDGSNGFNQIEFFNLLPDSSIEFYVKVLNSEVLKPLAINNSTNPTTYWNYIDYALLSQYEYTSNSDGFFSWNSYSTTKVYIGFRKIVGSDYKYGWVKFANDKVGPAVIQW